MTTLVSKLKKQRTKWKRQYQNEIDGAKMEKIAY